jgi:FAD/FMN-containing dehydrogenase
MVATGREADSVRMVLQLDPNPTQFDSSPLERLARRLAGEMILPDDEAYDSARRIWNKEFVRNPRLVVHAADVVDVIHTVNFARDNGLALAVRSGGHSLAGFGSVDDGVVLDLSGFKGITIDPESQVAWVQPAVTSEELAPRAAEYGLGLSTGDAPTVGVGGLTLGGGIGFMVRKYGLTIDSLLSAEVVTADGQLVTASPTEHPDLFWALRGGGGNFGVVTAFQFKLRPVGTVLGGALIYPASKDLITTYARRALEAPDGLTTISNLVTAPPLPIIPQELHGQPILLILAVHVGDLEEGQRAMEPLRTLGPGLVDLTGPMPYHAIFDFTREETVSMHSVSRTLFVNEFPEALAETLIEHVEHGTSPASFVQIRPLGGALKSVPNDATAFAHRDKSYMLALINGWNAPAGSDSTVHYEWVQRIWDAVRPYGEGVYVNFLQVDETDRLLEAYPELTYERLVAVKRRYDPNNFFCLNQNIAP